MIELLIQSRCVQCNQCVHVCPANVFQEAKGESPIIARKSDCQTCYMCELYCPANALYVAPNAFESLSLKEEDVIKSGLVGSYKASIGWEKGKENTAKKDHSYVLLRKV
jgi:NAD-dependent dihydropyrimidine dehydrogenase PreA subunit